MELTREEFLHHVVKTEALYSSRALLISTMTLPITFKSNTQEGWDGKVLRIDGEEFTFKDVGENEVIFPRKKPITIKRGDFAGVRKDKIETTYQTVLRNTLLFSSVFGDEIDFIEDAPLKGDKIDEMVNTRLREKTMTVEQLMKLTRHLSFIGCLEDILVPAYSKEMMRSIPAVTKNVMNLSLNLKISLTILS